MLINPAEAEAAAGFPKEAEAASRTEAGAEAE
jgi:hypothetical protein